MRIYLFCEYTNHLGLLRTVALRGGGLFFFSFRGLKLGWWFIFLGDEYVYHVVFKLNQNSEYFVELELVFCLINTSMRVKEVSHYRKKYISLLTLNSKNLFDPQKIKQGANFIQPPSPSRQVLWTWQPLLLLNTSIIHFSSSSTIHSCHSFLRHADIHIFIQSYNKHKQFVV